MKNRLSLIIVCCLLMLSGCSYDNYDEPTSVLSGRVVYNGQALPVKTDGTGFILWQDGMRISQVLHLTLHTMELFLPHCLTGSIS